nr:hypothetical protein [uncultured Tyzzerella sp.]
MGNKLSLYIEKLNIKKNNLKEFLDYVSSKDFKISEEELQHIENYLQKRDSLLKDLKAIENDIKNINVTNEEKNNEIVLTICKENDNIISEILELDKKNEEKFSKISDMLKGNVKAVKNTSKVNKSYYGAYTNHMMGSYFDSKS